MATCRVISCVFGRGCLLWPVHSLGKTLLPLPCFILYSKAKFACYSSCFLTSYFCISVPYNEKDVVCGWVLVATWGLSLAVASRAYSCCDAPTILLRSTGSGAQASAAVAHRLSCAVVVGSSQTRDWTHVPGTGRRFLTTGPSAKPNNVFNSKRKE